MSKNNQDVLNRPIHLKMLIGFSLPTILSMVFMSIYTTVDGLFVASLDGVWRSMPIDEFLSFAMSVYYFRKLYFRKVKV